MDIAAGPSHRTDEYVSLEDVVKLLYFYGLSSLYLWEDAIKNIKTNIINLDDLDVFNLYIRLTDITKKIRLALELTVVNSQKDLLSVNNYLFDIDEIYDYLSLSKMCIRDSISPYVLQ